MTHEVALSLALAVALGVIAWARWYLSECRCASCQFHIHERRVAAETAKRAAEVEAKRQADLGHEYAHKGGGFQDGDPDRFNCHDDECRRNRPVR